MGPFPRAARVYIASVIALGLGLVALLAVVDGSRIVDVGSSRTLGDLWLVAFFIVFGVTTSVRPVTTPGGITFTGNLAPLFAAVLVLPPGAAAIVAALGSIDQRLPGRSIPWYRFLFNRGLFGLVYGLAALCFHLTLALYPTPCGAPGVTGCLASQLTLVSAAVVALVVVAATNTPLVVAVVALTSGRDFRKVAYEGLQGLLLSYVGLAPLAGLIAYLVSGRTLASLGMAASISILLLVYRQLSSRSFRLQHVAQGSYVSQSRLIDKKDRSTFGHSERVGILAAATATKMGLSVDLIEQIRIGATLHDLGKVAIPDSILHKPGALTEEEWEIMKTHTVEGYEVLREQGVLERAAEIVRSHHENYDGTGYPMGHSGREIPVGGRITRIVDSYDCITNVRDYREWMKTPFDALSEINALAGKWYDPEIVRAFTEVLIESNPDLRVLRTGGSSEPDAGIGEALRFRPFLSLWLSHGLSNFGDMLTTTGLALTAFASTHTVLAVGAIFAARAVPNLLLGLVAGPYADRFDRKAMMLVMDVTRAVLVGALPFLIGAPLPVMLAITVAVSTATVFFNPARSAALPDLVRPQLLHASNAALTLIERVTEILGYVAAALIIVVGGVPLVFAIDALTFLLSAGLILTVSFPDMIRDTGNPDLAAIRRDVVEGIWLIRRHRQLRVILLFSFFMVAAGSALLPLMVPLALDHLHAGQPGFGLLEASIAAGATLGSVLSGLLQSARRGSLMIMGAAGMGVATTFAGAAPVLPMAMMFLFVGGVANVVFLVPMITAIQELTDTEIRGRIFAVRYSLVQLGILVGIAYASLVQGLFSSSGDGAAFAIVLSGLLMVAVAIVAEVRGGLRDV